MGEIIVGNWCVDGLSLPRTVWMMFVTSEEE